MTYWPPAPVVTELHQMVTPNIVRLKCLHIQGKIFLRQKNMKRKSGVQILECALLSQDQGGYHLHFQCREMRRLLLVFETKRRRFQWQKTALEISPCPKYPGIHSLLRATHSVPGSKGFSPQFILGILPL